MNMDNHKVKILFFIFFKVCRVGESSGGPVEYNRKPNGLDKHLHCFRPLHSHLELSFFELRCSIAKHNLK